MAATLTYVGKIPLPNGLVLEFGTWDSNGVTAGTITANSTDQPEIQKIVAWGGASDGDSTALVFARDVADNQLKLTFANPDTGDYWFIGTAA